MRRRWVSCFRLWRIRLCSVHASFRQKQTHRISFNSLRKGNEQIQLLCSLLFLWDAIRVEMCTIYALRCVYVQKVLWTLTDMQWTKYGSMFHVNGRVFYSDRMASALLIYQRIDRVISFTLLSVWMGTMPLKVPIYLCDIAHSFAMTYIV